MDASLQRAVIEARGLRDPLGAGDPNTIDLYLHARKVEDLLGLGVPHKIPGKDAGVALVELVERYFVRSELIRTLSPTEISERAGALVDAIAGATLLADSPGQCYIAALYAWHGCINMAKMLRPTSVTPDGEADITMGQRTQDYACLSTCWSEEIARGTHGCVTESRWQGCSRRTGRATASRTQSWKIGYRGIPHIGTCRDRRSWLPRCLTAPHKVVRPARCLFHISPGAVVWPTLLNELLAPVL